MCLEEFECFIYFFVKTNSVLNIHYLFVRAYACLDKLMLYFHCLFIVQFLPDVGLWKAWYPLTSSTSYICMDLDFSYLYFSLGFMFSHSTRCLGSLTAWVWVYLEPEKVYFQFPALVVQPCNFHVSTQFLPYSWVSYIAVNVLNRSPKQIGSSSLCKNNFLLEEICLYAISLH